MIFQSEHAENISYAYLLYEIFESILDFFAKEISNRIESLPMELFVCVYLLSLDKKIVHCCFSID